MNLNDYIGEATAYDKKLMLERKDPTSWLKSVSAFANTQGGRLLFGVANDGALVGLADAGGMPSGHCVQELDARQVTSKRRNPVIADLFQRLDLMERRGSGFKKILDAYAFESEKRGETVVPRFESTQTDFFLILPNLNYGRKTNGVESSSEHFDVEVTTEADTNKTGMKTGMNTGGTVNLPVDLPVNLPENLTATAKKIYDLLREDGKYTYDRLAEAVGVTRETVRVSIRSLVEAKLIQRIGSDKTGHWEVVK